MVIEDHSKLPQPNEAKTRGVTMTAPRLILLFTNLNNYSGKQLKATRGKSHLLLKR